MRNAKWTTAIVTFAGPLLATAQSQVTSGRVVNLELSADGSVRFQLEGGPSLCAVAAPITWAQASEGYVPTGAPPVGWNSERIRGAVSILTSAQLSGKAVRVMAYDDPTDVCYFYSVSLCSTASPC